MDTNDKNKKYSQKLEYIGLDLDSIPEFLKKFEGLDYRPSRNYDERNCKTYRYLDIEDIKILLTPKNRLDGITEKYAKAVPIYSCLDPKKEENIEFHTRFLKMINNISIEALEGIEKQQKLLREKTPFKIKYYKDYLWQIHYSEFTNKYFMLAPMEDQEQSSFFYLLKKQIEKSKEKIFVPICYSEYTGEYLKRSEIEEIERYIWFFTKEWPLTYDVYDKNDRLSLYITGKTVIYENMQSDYSIKLSDKEQAISFYKLIKALFILQTELPHYYNFEIKLDKQGSLDFYFNNEKITYDSSPDFIKQEYLKLEEQERKASKDKKKLDKKLENIKAESGRLDFEYLQKEKEITTYLECKKTFFGKVKYFFTKKKQKNITNDINNNDKSKQEEKDNNEESILNQYDDKEKQFYTLEELIERYKILDNEVTNIKNIKLDISAGENRIKNMKLKIRNATLYLEEIDKHTKSIFEFWKFTNKDRIESLVEGKKEEDKEARHKKTFDYKLDFEDFSIELDKRQRNILSKEELNSVFMTSTSILNDINKVANKIEITDERVEELRKDILNKKMFLNNDKFDIFGSVVSTNNKLSMLSNKKHRESARDEIRLLDINKETNSKEYTSYLEKILENINSAFNKTSMKLELPIYKVLSGETLNNYLNIFDINEENIVNELENTDNNKPANLIRINLKEDTKAIGFTNILYYENNNQTLPLGMGVSQKVLIDKSLLELVPVDKQEIRTACYKEKDDELSDIFIKTVNIEEYDVLY